MRLVVKFQVTDDYTYWCTLTVPVEYESAEAFAVDFEKVAMDSYNTGGLDHGAFMFAGHEWNSVNHRYYDNGKNVYNAPTILTVDEWFSGVTQ